MGSVKSDHMPNHTSSHNINPLDPEEFKRQGHMIIDFLADYYRDVEKYPVLAKSNQDTSENACQSPPHIIQNPLKPFFRMYRST